MSHTSSLCSRVVGVVGVDSTISVNEATTPPAEHSYTPLSPGCGSGIRSVFPSAGIGRGWLSCRDHSTSTPGDTLHVSTTSSPAIVVPEEGPSMITVAKHGGGKSWGEGIKDGGREERERGGGGGGVGKGTGESGHHHLSYMILSCFLFPLLSMVSTVVARRSLTQGGEVGLRAPL